MVTAILCPLCRQLVTPVKGELRACTCGKTIGGVKPNGELYVAGPVGIEYTQTIVPYSEQLRLPL